MEIIVTSLVAIKREDLPQRILEDLLILAIRENPDWSLKKRRGYPVSDDEQYVLSYKYSDDGIYVFFNRGLLSKIIVILKEHNIPIRISDRRTVSPPLNCLMRWDIDLFKYQDKSVNSLIEEDDGILVADCGAGKTVIGSAIISKINQRTLIVVTSIEIMKQWVDSIQKFTDHPKHKIGKIGQGCWNIKPITVATFQSLGKVDSERQKELNDYFGCMILDECHHNSAALLYRIANKTRARFKYGLTATPNRKDKKEFMVFNAISHRLVYITSSELEAEGRSVVPSVRVIDIPIERVMPTCFRWNGKKQVEEVDWSNFYSDLTKDENRNKIIIDSIIQTVKEGHICLVLSNRVEHCQYIYNKLVEAGLRAGLVLGSSDKDDRTDIMDSARKGELDVVVATNNLAAEGLDIPTLSCVHLFIPTTNNTFLKQATGRIRRPKQDKIALVVDYTDKDEKDKRILYNMYMYRLRYYRELGYPIHLPENRIEIKHRLI